MELGNWTIYAVYMAITSLIVLVFGIASVRKASKIPGRLQGFVEWVMVSLRGVFLGALGPGGEKHLPLILALFWYILFCNLIELVPLFKAATSNPSNTIALGLIVFVYTQYVGITSRGLKGYLSHFLGPFLILAPLFIVIEVAGELIKPFSLGMRLAGNVYAEDKMNDMALTSIGHYVPLQLLVYPLQIFTGVIQAFIFPMLACAYIGMMSQRHHDNGDNYNSQPHAETTTEKLSDSIGSIGAHI